MSPRLLLIASNLAMSHFTAVLSRLLSGRQRGAVVTTAEPKAKERGLNAILAHATLTGLGIPSVTFFDLDRQGGADLGAFDFVYLGDGNPYYLLQRLRETEADTALEEMISHGQPVIGSGAGAVVLGASLRHLLLFNSAVSDGGWKDSRALGVAPFSILPHANRWQARYHDYTSRLKTAEGLCGGSIEELADGDALLLERGTCHRITAPSPMVPLVFPSLVA